MGYYTDYTLESDNDLFTIKTPEFATLFKEVTSGYSFPFTDSIKWYNWEEDMCAISKRYPSVLFTLTGIGEDSEDQWRAYFKNGLNQTETAVITYAPFNPDKLK